VRNPGPSANAGDDGRESRAGGDASAGVVYGGNTKFEHKVVGMFELQTEIIRKKSEQAHRVRQNGESAGSREPDRDVLCSV
jgi:hypothetical protein